MATVEHAIEEHDVVAIREVVDAWPAGTEGTVVSMYDTAALVEVSWTEPPEETLRLPHHRPVREARAGLESSHRRRL